MQFHHLRKNQLNGLNKIIIIRGGGDIGAGVAHRLFNAGFNVLITELEFPLVIRRMAAFSSAVYSKVITVEDVTARYAEVLEDIEFILQKKEIPVIVDSDLKILKTIKPFAVIDATLSKKNIGTSKLMADITIALGPGYCAGKDVDAVIETNRGHNLGRIIYKGSAEENTGEAGNISGFKNERVLRATASGKIKNTCDIGCLVNKGDIISVINNSPVTASISGVIRGLIIDGFKVFEGQKIGDIDPRGKTEYCNTISDKARTISGGVLEVIMHLSK